MGVSAHRAGAEAGRCGAGTAPSCQRRAAATSPLGAAGPAAACARAAGAPAGLRWAPRPKLHLRGSTACITPRMNPLRYCPQPEPQYMQVCMVPQSLLSSSRHCCCLVKPCHAPSKAGAPSCSIGAREGVPESRPGSSASRSRLRSISAALLLRAMPTPGGAGGSAAVAPST